MSAAEVEEWKIATSDEISAAIERTRGQGHTDEDFDLGPVETLERRIEDVTEAVEFRRTAAGTNDALVAERCLTRAVRELAEWTLIESEQDTSTADLAAALAALEPWRDRLMPEDQSELFASEERQVPSGVANLPPIPDPTPVYKDPTTGAPLTEHMAFMVQTEINRADAREMAARIRAKRDAVEIEEDQAVPSGDWLFATYEDRPALWGLGDEVLMADAESLFICAKAGVGKTTLAGLLIRGFCGLTDEVLGYPVQPVERVLLLAMDRPAQVRRALRRQFTEGESETLNERLSIRPGPLTGDLADQPELLRGLAYEYNANLVIVDSAKDALTQMTDDRAAGNFNRAIQGCLADGIAVVVLHHQRKGTGDSKPNTLEDVYGSTWITAGAGSVILLWGEPGAGSVELMHLKSPQTPVGPLSVEINTSTGEMTANRGWDPLTYLQNRASGATTVAEAGQAMFGRKASSAENEKARRRLDNLVKIGLASKDVGGLGAAAIYRLSTLDAL